MTDDAIRQLRCACGWEASGNFEALVIAAQEHGRRIHNMAPTREEVEAMLLPIGPAGAGADHRAQPDDASGRSS
jgi:predicted small metal-binding protein